jgi:hypothetical protein
MTTIEPLEGRVHCDASRPFPIITREPLSGYGTTDIDVVPYPRGGGFLAFTEVFRRAGRT